MSEPILSVCLITYNQVKFLDQTIRAILAQQFDYPWEFIIADDMSSDGSREMIERFAKIYPELIIPMLGEVNLGPAANWRRLVEATKGKYIAYCEGDDYWNDSNKLNEQVTFLENHPEFVGCFHNTEERYEETENASTLYSNFPKARSITFEDLSFMNYIPSVSMMYRNRLVELPEWLFKLKMGDWPLHLLNAQYGNFWYIPKVMAVHRIHKGSTWMSLDGSKMDEYLVEGYEAMKLHFRHNTELVAKLETGMKRYLSRSAKPSIKARIKNQIKRIVDKL